MAEDLQKQWYVIQTLTGQEQKAQRQIVAQARTAGLCDYFDIPPESQKGEELNSFNIVVPTEKVVEIKDGKKRTVTRKTCPGYVLVRMALYADGAHKQIFQELWQFIQSIPGVIGFLGGTRTKPTPRPRRSFAAKPPRKSASPSSKSISKSEKPFVSLKVPS